jgi:hypothetical protein
MQILWQQVARTGGVIAARRAREAGGEARAKGYGEVVHEELAVEDEDDLQLGSGLREHSTAWWSDPVSGCPSTIEETIIGLLDSGFTPENCAVLRDKLKQVVKIRINAYVNRFKIEVPMSCTAFVVPGKNVHFFFHFWMPKTDRWIIVDPYGVLEADEIHIKSSRGNLEKPDGFDTDTIVGPVLVCSCVRLVSVMDSNTTCR